MKIFGHEFGKKPETPVVNTSEATPASVAAEPVLAVGVPTPEAPIAVVNTNEMQSESTVDTNETQPAITDAAAEIGHAADQLAAITNTETSATGSLDVALPSADAAIPTVAEQVAALDEAATPAAAPTGSDYSLPPQETLTVETPATEVPSVVSMDDDAIHNALGIPPIETTTEPTVVTPEQNQQ